MRIFNNVEEMKECVGQEIGVSCYIYNNSFFINKKYK